MGLLQKLGGQRSIEIDADALPAQLRSPDNETRKLALIRAGQLEDEQVSLEILEGVTKRTHDDDPRIRHAALTTLIPWVLRELIQKEASSTLAERAMGLLEDENPAVRAESVVLLALLDEHRESSVPKVLPLLRDLSALVRREAAAAMGDLKVDRARGTLVGLFDDEDIDTRFEAAFALASLGDARALPMLLRFLSVPRRRIDACEALRRLGDAAAIPELRRISDRLFLGWPERLTIHATLASLGDQGGARAVVERTKSRNRAERTLAIALLGSHKISIGVDVLKSLATDAGDRDRSVAIRAIGELGDPANRSFLEGLLGSLPAEDAEECRASLERLAVPG